MRLVKWYVGRYNGEYRGVGSGMSRIFMLSAKPLQLSSKVYTKTTKKREKTQKNYKKITKNYKTLVKKQKNYIFIMEQHVFNSCYGVGAKQAKSAVPPLTRLKIC